MRTLKSAILFLLAFLFAVEVFFTFDGHAKWHTVIPIAGMFALLIAVMRERLTELYKMAVYKDYKPKKRHSRHRHYRSHRHHRSHQ